MATTYKIQPGDTLSQLAQKYGTTIGALQQANPQITNPNLIYAGQSLVIPSAQQPTVQPVVQQAQQLTPEQTQYFTQQIQQIQQGISQLAPQVEQFTASQIQAAQAVQPTLPQPTAPTIQDQYTQSMLANLEAQRKQTEQLYTQQIEKSRQEATAAQQRIEQITATQKDILDTKVQELLTPFRADLEKAERERLKVEENYFANQTLVNELGTLLTDIQASLQREKDITGLAAIREPRIAQTREDAMARVGVIEAVMAARNNQITVANNLIDRASNAIAADKQDKLNYYNALLNFYDKQLGVEQAKLIDLTDEQRKWIDKEVGLIEGDLSRATANVEYIKQLMIDPNYAMMVAQSGITLNDTPQQANAKIAEWSYQEEVRNVANTMAAQGYTEITSYGAASKPSHQVTTLQDSKGNTRYYWSETLSPYDIAEQIVRDNPFLSEGELRLLIRRDPGAKGLSETDISSIVGLARPQAGTEHLIREAFIKWKDYGANKKQSENAWREQNNWPAGTSLPEPERTILDEVYADDSLGLGSRIKSWFTNLFR